MKKPMILLALVTGCGASDQPDTRSTANRSDGAETPAAAPASLVGLYEGGPASAPNRLCVVEKAGQARFGLLVWGAKLSACGGAGIVERDGDRLHLRMTGDQACTIPARLTNGTIAIEGPIPAGCAYYCGARVSLDGIRFAPKGGTVADAMKAKDPAGDPLCAS